MAQTSYFIARFPDGRVAVRSTESRAYAFCFIGPNGESWTSRRDLIPAGAPFAPAAPISAADYRDILKARDVAKAGGSELALKLKKARTMLRNAQYEQESAGQALLSMNLQLGGATNDQMLELTGWYGWSERQVASEGTAILVRQQQKQANAFQRIAKAMRDIARLEAKLNG